MKLRNLGIGILAAAVGCGGAAPSDSAAQVSAPGPSLAPIPAASIPESRRTAITTAVERVAPAVVTVQTETVERVAADPFEQFFGGKSGQRSAAGIGSGFVIRDNGVILTNAHVVAGASKVSVAMRDGTTYPAKIVGVDESNDLAVLKIDAAKLPVAPLGRSDGLLVGEWAVAIGNPYGFLLGNTEPSVTAGVVSGTGRNLVGRAEGNGVYVDMIQTDASINPGNSGGPLINAVGEVIGVNSSIYSPSGGSVGLGFAIPINRARRVAEDLLAHGAVRQPWIGVVPLLPDGDVRASLRGGVAVRAVAPSSPAQRAGIRPGDVMLRAGTRDLRNPFDWEAALLEMRVGDAIPLRIKRGDRELSLSVTVADRPEVSAPKVAVLQELELLTMTPAIRLERRIASPAGAVVYRISQRMQNEVGLESGDVIVQINRIPVSSAEDVKQALDRYAGRAGIQLFFERGGQVFTTSFYIR
jgi:serine protease Do